MNPVSFIATKINAKPKKKYDILTFSTHEAYQEAMAKTGHNFYLLQLDGQKKWNANFRRVPDNCVLINSFVKIPKDIDFMISQERYSQIQAMLELSNVIRAPLIHIDHVEPIKNEQFNFLKSHTADKHVFITKHNMESWEGDGEVVNHGIDTEVFSGWKPNKSKTVVYTVNYLKDRDFFCGWKEWNYVRDRVGQIDPTIKFILIGDNPGISNTISDPIELSKKLVSCSCYINTSKFSPVPMSLLEAMSCGMPVVSTRYQQVAKILNDKNSISSNDLDILAKAVVDICNNQESHVSIGESARKLITSNFSMEDFIDKWNRIFDETYNLKLSKPHEILHIQ